MHIEIFVLLFKVLSATDADAEEERVPGDAGRSGTPQVIWLLVVSLQYSFQENVYK